METVTVVRVIAAPVDTVFDWCATTTNYARSPLVLRARLARPGDGAPYGVGAVRVHTWLIGWFRERITAYQSPHGFDYVVERSFPPIRHELGRMSFTAVPDGTRVVWETTVRIRSRIGIAVFRAVGKPLLVAVFRQILDAGDRALTTTNRRHQ